MINNKTTNVMLTIFISMFLLCFILMYSMLYSISMLDTDATSYAMNYETMSSQLGIILWLLLTSIGCVLATLHISHND